MLCDKSVFKGNQLFLHVPVDLNLCDVVKLYNEQNKKKTLHDTFQA